MRRYCARAASFAQSASTPSTRAARRASCTSCASCPAASPLASRSSPSLAARRLRASARCHLSPASFARRRAASATAFASARACSRSSRCLRSATRSIAVGGGSSPLSPFRTASHAPPPAAASAASRSTACAVAVVRRAPSHPNAQKSSRAPSIASSPSMGSITAWRGTASSRASAPFALVGHAATSIAITSPSPLRSRSRTAIVVPVAHRTRHQYASFVGHSVGGATPYTSPLGETAMICVCLRRAAPAPRRNPRCVYTPHCRGAPRVACAARSHSPSSPPHPLTCSASPVALRARRSCSYLSSTPSTAPASLRDASCGSPSAAIHAPPIARAARCSAVPAAAASPSAVDAPLAAAAARACLRTASLARTTITAPHATLRQSVALASPSSSYRSPAARHPAVAHASALAHSPSSPRGPSASSASPAALAASHHSTRFAVRGVSGHVVAASAAARRSSAATLSAAAPARVPAPLHRSTCPPSAHSLPHSAQAVAVSTRMSSVRSRIALPVAVGSTSSAPAIAFAGRSAARIVAASSRRSSPFVAMPAPTPALRDSARSRCSSTAVIRATTSCRSELSAATIHLRTPAPLAAVASGATAYTHARGSISSSGMSAAGSARCDLAIASAHALGAMPPPCALTHR